MVYLTKMGCVPHCTVLFRARPLDDPRRFAESSYNAAQLTWAADGSRNVEVRE